MKSEMKCTVMFKKNIMPDWCEYINSYYVRDGFIFFENIGSSGLFYAFPLDEILSITTTEK